MFSSQNFGASQGAATLPMGGMGLGMESAGSQAAKPARKEERLSVLPVTVRVLEDAAAVAKTSGGDGNIMIHGSEPGMVLFVGCVESVSKQTSSAEFVVNDSTGRMRVKYFGEADSALASIEAGKYVTVAGNLRTTPAVHVSATSLRAVRSADEISYHMIEVAHAMLKLTRPQPAMTAAPKDVIMTQAVISATPPPKTATPEPLPGDVTMTPAKLDAPAAAAIPAAKGGQGLDGAALRAEVLKVLTNLHSQNPSEEGVHKDKVVACLASTPQAKVFSMLKTLDEEGEIFQTIGDDFYAPL